MCTVDTAYSSTGIHTVLLPIRIVSIYMVFHSKLFTVLCFESNLHPPVLDVIRKIYRQQLYSTVPVHTNCATHTYFLC